MISKFLSGGLALGLGFVAIAGADEPNKDSVVGAKVKLTACVITDKENSFILTHVDEIYGPKSSTSTPTPMAMSGMKDGGPNEVIYWLSSDSVKKMRGHLGHKVEVTGEISEVTMGTIRTVEYLKTPGVNNDTKVEIDARGKESDAKTDRPVDTGPLPTEKSDETQKLPVRRVKVKSVKVLSNTCP
jgi:hypothetical protein